MDKKKTDGKVLYLPIGMCLGLSIGMAIGSAMGNISVGMCMGLGIGLCFGSAMDSANRTNKAESEDREKEETD